MKKFIRDYIRRISADDRYRDIPVERWVVPVDGTPGGYLYAAVTRPAGDAGAQRAGRVVVVCPPFLEERVLTHRLLHRLQKRLSLEGYATVRFDYRGTGDSGGDVSAVTLDTMRRDVSRIVDRAHDQLSPRRLTVLGVRLGATVALDSGPPAGVDSAVLWSPVVSTPRYVEELYKLQILSDARFGLPVRDSAHFSARVRDGKPVEILGYRLGPEFLRQCEQRSGAPVDGAFERVDVFRLGLRQSRVYAGELDALIAALRSGPAEVYDHAVRCPSFWSDGRHLWEELPELYEETLPCLAPT